MTEISGQDTAIIMQTIKTLLLQNEEPWVKKSEIGHFDVPISCYDGTEVCELVGSYMLIPLTHCVNKESINLYRDDSLGVFSNFSKPKTERKKKQIVKIFKEYG